jgi:hypothetical protein
MTPLRNISKYFIQHASLFGLKVAPPQPNIFVHNLRQEITKLKEFPIAPPDADPLDIGRSSELKDLTSLRCYAARWPSVQPTEAANEREFSFTGSKFESRKHYETRDKLQILFMSNLFSEFTWGQDLASLAQGYC